LTRRRPSPEDVQRIVAHAQQHVSCEDCGAAPGEPCIRPGGGRSVHKSRYISAAIEIKQALRAAALTLEQQVVLAGLPKVPKAEIEKCRTPAGGYSLTRAWFLEHGLPYPPIPGWRRAVEREDEGVVSE
jgi:ribosomal protein S27E